MPPRSHLLKKIIPVFLTGMFLMWVLYILLDHEQDVDRIKNTLLLPQLAILGTWLYYAQYRKWHLARKLLKDGVCQQGRVRDIVIVRKGLIFSLESIKLSYQFYDCTNSSYCRTVHYPKRQFIRWFSNIPNVGGLVNIVYNPSNANQNMMVEEAQYGKTSSKF